MSVFGGPVGFYTGGGGVINVTVVAVGAVSVTVAADTVAAVVTTPTVTATVEPLSIATVVD